MRRIPWISTTWEEGRVFDRWMIVHFLSGVAGGFSNVLFGLSTRGVYALGMSLLLLWEVGEHFQRVGESWENRVLDLVVGGAGIWVALWCADRMSAGQEMLAFAASTAATVAGSALGGLAFRARTRESAAADREPTP
ncbi:MAG: hypothetical protein K8S21_05060 [Gemmatimonadetes bacterium]|nr:hypothetical protein [Gemmatimonadota bacterium]